MPMSFVSLTKRSKGNQPVAQKIGLAFGAFLDVLFAVKLRESLDAVSTDDKTEAAKILGL